MEVFLLAIPMINDDMKKYCRKKECAPIPSWLFA